MSEISEQLRSSDPVRMADLEAVADHPVFAELFDDIVTGAPAGVAGVPSTDEAGGRPALIPSEPGAGRRRHSRPLVSAVVAAAAALVVALVVVHSPGRVVHNASRPGATSRVTPAHRVTASWKLVGDISSSWQVLSGSGYKPDLLLTCPAANTCYADNLWTGEAGDSSEVEVTHDGGSSWQTAQLPGSLSFATPLSCTDAETCAALGVNASGEAVFVTTTDGGQDWASVAGPTELTSAIGVTALSCPTASACVAVASDPAGQSGDTVAFSTTDGGATWQTSVMPENFDPRQLSCQSGGECVVDGIFQSPDGSTSSPSGTILYSSDGGTTWATAALPAGLGALSSLGCEAGGGCTATFFGNDGAASEVLTSSDFGQSWSPATASGLPDAFVTGLSCSTDSDCWASGIAGVPAVWGGGDFGFSLQHTSGVVASTSDGGQTWQSSTLPDGVPAVLAIACPTSTTCYAVGIEEPLAGSPTSPSTPVFVLLAYDN